jgi:prepilin-type N-terminal cleavage/methylation domain-containing protein
MRPRWKSVQSIRLFPILYPEAGNCSESSPDRYICPNRSGLRRRLALRAESGFSLIELMIGSAVLVIAMGAMASVLRVSHSLQSKTQVGIELAQNVNSALNFICRELINAGSGVPYLTNLNGSPEILVPAGALLGPLGGVVNSGRVYFVTPCYRTGSSVNKDGEGHNLAQPVRTDMLVFLGGTGDVSFVNQVSPGPSANWGQMVYVENRNLFVPGQAVLISNGFQVSLGQITQVQSDGGLRFDNGSDSLRLNPGSTEDVPNPNMVAAQQMPGGPPPQVFPLSAITYFIDSTTDPVHPSIKRLANSGDGAAGAVAVADDIENLQVAFFVDHDSNATTPAIEITNPAVNQLSLVRGVKISITGRSREKMGDAAWPDQHSRLTLSQTVFFRNNIRR